MEYSALLRSCVEKMLNADWAKRPTASDILSINWGSCSNRMALFKQEFTIISVEKEDTEERELGMYQSGQSSESKQSFDITFNSTLWSFLVSLKD